MSPHEESKINPINNTLIYALKLKNTKKNNGFKIRIEKFLIPD